MTPDDEVRRFALQDEALNDELLRQESDVPVGAPTLLARTKLISTYPTNAASYFACLPLTLLGPEVEGGQGVVSARDATFFALNMGRSVPPVGTQVLVTFVGSRWVFRHDA